MIVLTDIKQTTAQFNSKNLTKQNVFFQVYVTLVCELSPILRYFPVVTCVLSFCNTELINSVYKGFQRIVSQFAR